MNNAGSDLILLTTPATWKSLGLINQMDIILRLHGNFHISRSR